MFYENKIKKLKSLDGVYNAAEIGDVIRILASSGINYDDIERIVEETDFDVAEVTEHPTDDYALFTGEARFHEFKGRHGDVRHPGEAKMIQARASLSHEPKTNVAIKDELGILFGSIQDKEKFSEWRKCTS